MPARRPHHAESCDAREEADGRSSVGNGLFSESEWCALVADLSLSNRQAETLRLIFEGLCDKQIAERLGITSPTVRTYVQRIYARLGVSDRASLVIEIFRRQRSSDRQEEPRMKKE